MVSVFGKSTKKLFSLGLSSKSSSAASGRGDSTSPRSSDLRGPISPSAGGSGGLDEIDESLEASHNREIERYLSEAGKKASRVMSVMMVGPGESGKTTFMKQLSKIHAGEVSEHLLMLSRASIRQNIVEGMQVLCRLSQKVGERQTSPALEPGKSSESAMAITSLGSVPSHSPPLLAVSPASEGEDDEKSLSVEELAATRSDGEDPTDLVDEIVIGDVHNERALMKDAEMRSVRDQVLSVFDQRSLDQDLSQLVTREVRDNLDRLWMDHSIQYLFSIRHTFQLAQVPYHLDYFMNRSFIVWEEDYLPSFDDYIKVRVRSTGIREEIYRHRTDDGKKKTRRDTLSFKFIDVGGQRSERRKWVRRFDAIASVFIFGIGDYNLFCFEDGTTRRLVEALVLFEQLCSKRLTSSDVRRLGSLSKKASSPRAGGLDTTDLGTTFFDNQSLIVFFNKWDVLEKKLQSGLFPFEQAFAPSPALSESLMLDSPLPSGSSAMPSLKLGSSSGSGALSGSCSVKGSVSPRSGGLGSMSSRVSDSFYTSEKIDQLYEQAKGCGQEPKKVGLLMQREMESVIRHYKPRIIGGSAVFHRTRATSTSNAQRVMRSVQKRIIQQSLTEFGLA